MSYGPMQWFWACLMCLAAIGFGFAPLFVRDLSAAGMAASAIVFFRFAPTALLSLPSLSLRVRDLRAIGMGLVAGVAVGLGWIAMVIALETVSVTTAGVIYLSYPLATVFLAGAIVGRIPGSRGVFAAILVFCALWLIVESGELLDVALLDLCVMAAAPLGFALAITIQSVFLIRLSPMSRLAAVSLGASLTVLPLVLIDLPDVKQGFAAHWGLIVCGALATSLIPSLIVLVASPRIGVLRSALTGSLELPIMVFVGGLAFAEAINIYQFLAVGLTILAVLILALSNQPKGRPAVS